MHWISHQIIQIKWYSFTWFETTSAAITLQAKTAGKTFCGMPKYYYHSITQLIVTRTSQNWRLPCTGSYQHGDGSEPYQELCDTYHKPFCDHRFEPLDILQAILMLVTQIVENFVVNQYKRIVHQHGNELAQQAISEVFAWKLAVNGVD